MSLLTRPPGIGRAVDPYRAFSFMFHLIGEGEELPLGTNIIKRIDVGPFSALHAYATLTVRMR